MINNKYGIEKQCPVSLTTAQKAKILRLVKNAFSAICYKTIFSNGKVQYTDIIVFDKHNMYLDNILSSEIGLYSTI